jgi:membrane-associated phospholipid phosphatase
MPSSSVFLRFVEARLSRSGFWGLPFTCLSAAFVAGLLLLAGLTEDIVTNESIAVFDLRFAHSLYGVRVLALLRLLYWVTLFGTSGIVIAAVLLLAFLLWQRRQRLMVLCLVLTLGISESVTLVAKLVFHRARPDLLMRAVTESSYSFPSGHATTAAAFFGFLAYLVIRTHRAWSIRIAAVLGMLSAVVLIDFSRLYLGVHYLSDVLAGDLVGFLGLLVAIAITEWMLARQPHEPVAFRLRYVGAVLLAQTLLVAAVSVLQPLPGILPALTGR